MDDSQKLLRRLSNFSFALAALSVIVPAVFVALFAYQIQNLKQNEKPAPQTETVAPGATKDSGSSKDAPAPALTRSQIEQREWARIWMPILFGVPFAVMFMAMIGVGLAITIVAPLVLGWQLRTHRRYDISLAAAALNCAFIPFGTILGGWTILVLLREPVRALFADRASVPVSEDDELHLRLLSRFHYAVSLVHGAYCAHPLVFMALPVMLITMPAQKSPSPVAMFWIFGAFGAVFFLGLLALSVCTWRAGRYLKEHSHRTFCLVVAALNCMMGPHGTILGVFTILVLSRPSVRLLFESPPATPLPIEADY